MNATRLSDRGQTGELDRADLEQPTPKRTVGRAAAMTAPQRGRVDTRFYAATTGIWLLWK